MFPGIQNRLRRIIKFDGRALIVALDHGLPGVSPLVHLTQPAGLLETLIASGADAILTTPGIAARFAGRLGSMGLIVRLDGASTSLSQAPTEMRLIASVEDALRLGADAVALMGFPGAPDESNSLHTLGSVAVECRRMGLPLMAEILPLGYSARPDIEQLKIAARIGAELGADLIKTRYVGPPEAFRQVIENCYAPVLILGGSSRSPDEVAQDVQAALQAGAAGAVVGRNIWQAEDPGRVTRMLVQAVHKAQFGLPDEE